MKPLSAWDARDWTAAFSFWDAVSPMVEESEGALFALIAARLSHGVAPNMMHTNEEALENLVHERGHAMAKLTRGKRHCELSQYDPDFFERLNRSGAILADLACSEEERIQVGFLMDSLYDAFSFGVDQFHAEWAQRRLRSLE